MHAFATDHYSIADGNPDHGFIDISVRLRGGRPHAVKMTALNIDITDSGVLFDDMLFAKGSTVKPGRFIQPRIEVETAFVMKAPIAGEDVTREDVIAATELRRPQPRNPRHPHSTQRLKIWSRAKNLRHDCR